MKHTTKLLVLFGVVIGAVGLAATGWAYFTASGSGTASATVGTWSNDTTTAVVSTGSPSVVGQQVTYTATVSAPGSGTPTGNIAFFDAGSPIGSCGGATGNPLSGASATCAQTYTAPGDHTITAAYQGDATYNASPTSPSITQVVNKASTTTSLTVTGSPVAYGSEQTAVFASTVSPQFAGAPQPTGTIAVKQGTTPLCSITLPAGSCSTSPGALNASATAYPVTAVYSGDSNFTGSTSSSQNLTVDKGFPVIDWATPAPITYGTALSASQLNASINGGIPGGFVYSPGAGSVPTAGSAPLSVTFTPTDTTNYTTATGGVTLMVNKASQTVTITSTAPVAASVGGSTYTVTATGGGSGNPVTFASGTTSVCTVSGSTVTFVGAGTCTVNANQAGNTNYDPAPQAQQSFSVAKGAQTVSFTSTAPTTATVDGTIYTVAASATSGLTVAFTSASTPVCTVSGSTVTFVGAGTCTVNANQAGNTNYDPAPQAQQSFSVGKGAQTISFTSTAPTSATAGGATYTVSATASSGLAVTFTSATTSVCTVSGPMVTFVAAGTCTINANQAGDANWNAATQVQQSMSVSPPLLSFTHSNFNCSSGSIIIPSGSWTANVSRGGSTTAGVTVTVAPVASGGTLTIAAGASESSAQFTVNRPGNNSGLVVTASSPGYASISCTVYKS